jgi:hypothetical protein
MGATSIGGSESKKASAASVVVPLSSDAGRWAGCDVGVKLASFGSTDERTPRYPDRPSIVLTGDRGVLAWARFLELLGSRRFLLRGDADGVKTEGAKYHGGLARFANSARRRRRLVGRRHLAGRMLEEIGGFENETDANEWVAKKFQTWLDDREKKGTSA